MLSKNKINPRLMGNLALIETYISKNFCLIKTKTEFWSIQKQIPDDQSKFVAHDFKVSLSKRRVM